MQYGNVPGLAKPISRLVMGNVMLASKEMEKGFALLDAAFDLGYNTFDTAHIYGGGDCERVLGRWMEARSNRDQVVVVTKGAHHNGDRKRVTPFDIASDMHDSLARLRTDYIDVYLLHRDDPAVPVGPIVEALNEHLWAGRIRAFGGSNWSHERIREANEYAAMHGLTPFAVSSPNFSLAVQVKEPWGGCTTITGAENAPAREWYRRQNVPVFSWSSLAGGFFSGRVTKANYETAKETLSASTKLSYCHDVNLPRLERAEILAGRKGVTIPQIAVGYVLAQPMNIFALVAPVTREECESNAKAMDIKLGPPELAWLNMESDIL
jgi:aryl-alcohol dehydrogenase-like predicted oxidoreductase